MIQTFAPGDKVQFHTPGRRTPISIGPPGVVFDLTADGWVSWRSEDGVLHSSHPESLALLSRPKLPTTTRTP